MSRFNKSFFAFTVIALLTTSTITFIGCDSKHATSYTSEIEEIEKNNSDTSSKDNKEIEGIKKSEKYNIKLELEKFNMPGIFTMDKPKGWEVYKAGEYNTLAFLTRDENEPLRQAFLFGEIGIFYIDGNQKNTEVYYQNNGGYKVPWIDMPVVSPFNGTTFFKNFYNIMNSEIGKNFLGTANMPIPRGLDQIEVISEENISPLLPGMSTILVRAILTNNGKAAQGMFTLSIYSDSYGHGSAYLVSGVTAPVNEYI